MQIDLDSQVSFLFYLPYTYSRYQLSGVAKGLCYLHSCNIIHGDLKGVCSSQARSTVILTPPSQTSS